MYSKQGLIIILALALSAVIGIGATDVSARERPSGSLVLVKGGVPASSIVIADDADWWQRQAAGWLQDYIERATNAKLPIVRESESPAGPLISVGHTKLT